MTSVENCSKAFESEDSLPLYVRPHSRAPERTSINSASMRSSSALRDTEPRTTRPTRSSRPALCGSTFAVSYRNTEPRALTRSVGMRERSLMSDSVMPSVRYSISGSCIRFRRVAGASGRR